MREIKFRAWENKNRRMIPVDTIDIKNKGIYSWVNNEHADGFFDTDFELMQYTGLKDKNGREIYEGDIVAMDKSKHENWHGVVSFSIDEFKGISKFHVPNLIWKISSCEIIGNMYENPELLEASHERKS